MSVSRDQIIDFIYDEARMLDEGRYDEWLFSQKPKSRCHHVIQRPFIDEFDEGAGRFKTNTSMHYVETRLDEQQLLALTATHDLVLVDGKLRIANKRVDLLNSDAAFGNIQLLP